MAAIAATQVSLYPNRYAEEYAGTVAPLAKIERRLKITGVTAGDTATAAVLGLATVDSSSSAHNPTGPAVVGVSVDPINNGILIGTGPSAGTIYLTVKGTPKTVN